VAVEVIGVHDVAVVESIPAALILLAAIIEHPVERFSSCACSGALCDGSENEWPKTPESNEVCGVGTMTAGARSASASAVMRSRVGVDGRIHSSNSLVRATPIGVPKPGS
jgi:hypothetical protein